MLTPGQVCEALNVPPSTLRRWAVRFADHLSPQPSGRGHRSYTVDDLNTFRKIKTLSGDGVLLSDIAERLNVVEVPPDQSTDLITTEGYTKMLTYAVDTLQAIQTTIADQGKRITQLESQAREDTQVVIEHKDDEIKRWREYGALPWWKRIFTKPPD
jgi:DNA-binding transcriptional MerR regulator